MANISGTVIQQAVRDVLENAHGSLRTISSGTYEGGLYEGLSDDAVSRRAISTPRIEPRVWVTGRNEASPPVHGSIALYDIRVEVRMVRHLDALHKLTDSQRDTVAANLAMLDADRVVQALTHLGNLTTDANSNATGIVSGQLTYEGSDSPAVELPDGGPCLVETTHNFTGVVQVTQATS